MFGLGRLKDSRDLATSYKEIFEESPQGRKILKDLRTFCQVDDWEHTNDPIELSKLVGRREVFAFIVNTLSDNYWNSLNEEIKIRRVETEELL